MRIGPGSYYRARHGIALSPKSVHAYSLASDFRVPPAGPWYCVFQTNQSNANDGDCFVRTSSRSSRSTAWTHASAGTPPEYGRGALRGTNYVVTGGGSWLDFPEPCIRDWPHMSVGEFHSIGGGVEKGLVNRYVPVRVDCDIAILEMIAFHADGSPMGILDAFSIERCDNGNGEGPERLRRQERAADCAGSMPVAHGCCQVS